MAAYREFQAGDVVEVIRYEDCPFTWVSEMERLVGHEVTIDRKEWSEGRKTYKYYIAEDDYGFMWCGNCFKYPVEIPDINEGSFLGIII